MSEVVELIEEVVVKVERSIGMARGEEWGRMRKGARERNQWNDRGGKLLDKGRNRDE